MAASIDARQFSNQRLYRRAPGVYRPLRNTVLGTWLIAIPIYATVPVAPPRLAHAGIVDAVSEQAGFALTGRSTLFFNPLAAVPSLHVGFAFRHRRWPDRHRDRLPHHAADSSCRSRLHRASIDRPTMTFSSACHHLERRSWSQRDDDQITAAADVRHEEAGAASGVVSAASGMLALALRVFLRRSRLELESDEPLVADHPTRRGRAQ